MSKRSLFFGPPQINVNVALPLGGFGTSTDSTKALARAIWRAFDHTNPTVSHPPNIVLRSKAKPTGLCKARLGDLLLLSIVTRPKVDFDQNRCVDSPYNVYIYISIVLPDHCIKLAHTLAEIKTYVKKYVKIHIRAMYGHVRAYTGIYKRVNGRGRTCKRTWMNVVKYHVHFLMSVTSFMSFRILIVTPFHCSSLRKP